MTTTEQGKRGRSVLLEGAVFQRCTEALSQFRQVTRGFAHFQMGFFALAAIELFCFLMFFSFFTRSSILAFSLAGIFLTGFSYFVLLFYFQTKKTEQLAHIKQHFIEDCALFLPAQENVMNRHLLLAQALHRLVGHLHNQEHTYYRLPRQLSHLVPLAEKFSAWSHWKDVHQMKETLLLSSIHEHTQLVKAAPTDPEAHASLASAYRALSQLYRPPLQGQGTWIARAYLSHEMQNKFRAAALRSLEELKIVTEYAPGEPWAYAHMASLYADLRLPEEEKNAYESLLAVAPQDKEALFRLGILYFQLGYAARALRIYDTFKRAGDPRADALISYYG